jgi:hypothetical protein
MKRHFMSSDSHPNDWEIPAWHPDFGDPMQEVNMLREFSLALLREQPTFRCQLITLEEGYLFVRILFPDDHRHAQLYVVVGDGRKRFAMYTFDGDNEVNEVYFDQLNDGLKELSRAIGGHD